MANLVSRGEQDNRCVSGGPRPGWSKGLEKEAPIWNPTAQIFGKGLSRLAMATDSVEELQ